MNTTSFSANARLAAVRDSLAELHRALLDAERRDIERETGRLSPGEYLQMLLHDPRFAWLRPVGRMVATLDGTMHEARKTGHEISDEEFEAALRPRGGTWWPSGPSSRGATAIAI